MVGFSVGKLSAKHLMLFRLLTLSPHIMLICCSYALNKELFQNREF